jgi:hypothetical protein
MTYIKPAHQDVLRMARSLIRDAAMNWARDELVASPEAVCEQLSGMLGEEYNFEKGEVVAAAKKKLFADTVLRKDAHTGDLFLMNHREKGWGSSAIQIASIEALLQNYDVTIGDWTSDQYSEYCWVRTVPC